MKFIEETYSRRSFTEIIVIIVKESILTFVDSFFPVPGIVPFLRYGKATLMTYLTTKFNLTRLPVMTFSLIKKRITALSVGFLKLNLTERYV